MVKSRIGIPLLALLVCLAAVPAFAAAPDPGKVRQLQANNIPLVSLNTWKDSTEQERYGFLVGFVTMMELERQWQGQNPLPLKLSLVQSWSKGFEGVTLKQIHDTLDEYIAANPKDLDRQVVEVLWFKFAQPKVKEQVGEPEKAPKAKKAVTKKKG